TRWTASPRRRRARSPAVASSSSPPTERAHTPVSALQDVLERAHRLGFLGPGPIDPHVDHARAFARAVGEAPDQAADLGSGGGVPAFVLIHHWPESRWWLIESRERRAAFLAEAVVALGAAGRVEVLHARAEDVGRDPVRREACGLVTARSF